MIKRAFDYLVNRNNSEIIFKRYLENILKDMKISGETSLMILNELPLIKDLKNIFGRHKTINEKGITKYDLALEENLINFLKFFCEKGSIFLKKDFLKENNDIIVLNNEINNFLKSFFGIDINVNEINISDIQMLITKYEELTDKNTKSGLLFNEIIIFLSYQILFTSLTHTSEITFKIVKITYGIHIITLNTLIGLLKSKDELKSLFSSNSLLFISKFSKENREILLKASDKKVSILKQSFILKKYDIGDINPILLEILVDNHKLFLGKDNISYLKLLNILIPLAKNNENNEVLEKINTFLKNIYKLNLSEETIIIIINNIINTGNILGEEKIYDILKGPKDSINIRLLQVLEDPGYIERIKKEALVNEIENDIDFIDDDSQGKDLLIELIEESLKLSYEQFKARKISIYIRYQIDELVKFNKRLLGDEVSNKERLSILGSFVKILKNFTNKEDIYVFIFSFNIEKIHIIIKLIEKINIPENISLKNFTDLINSLLENEDFHNEILAQDKEIEVNELSSIFNKERLKNKLLDILNTILGKEQLSLLDGYLNNIKFLSVIIDIARKIPENLKDDFILHISSLNFTVDEMKKILEIINFLNFCNIEIKEFDEILNLTKVNSERFNKIKNIIGSIEINTQNDILKRLIIEFLNSGDEEKLEKIIKSKNNSEVISNTLDKYLQEIINSGDIEKINRIGVLINRFTLNVLLEFNPNRLSSTRDKDNGKGSGKFSKRLNHLLLSQLKKGENEEYLDYLKRIKRINWSNISSSFSQLAESSGDSISKVIKNIIKDEELNFFDAIISFADKYFDLFQNYSGATIDLSDIKNEYNYVVKKEIEKLKRSLCI